MRYYVTGAAGFIGSHLCEELALLGHQITAFIHYNSRGDIGNLRYLSTKALRNVAIVKGDIQDPFSVEYTMRGHERVFHLAALIGIPYSYVSPASYVSTNIQGTLNVLEAAKKNRVKGLVHTSTSEVYGSAIYTPIDEKHPLQGQSPYSASKIGADQLAESYYRSFDLPVAIIRPFNTYGPRQSLRAVIPTIISQLLLGKKKIRLGSITPIRDFNYVKDTVAGFIRVSSGPEAIGKVINVGSGRGVSVKQVFKMIDQMLNTKAMIETDETRVRPQKSEVVELLCDHALAGKTVNYKPKWPLEKGLEATIAFIKENLEQYQHASEYMV